MRPRTLPGPCALVLLLAFAPMATADPLLRDAARDAEALGHEAHRPATDGRPVGPSVDDRIAFAFAFVVYPTLDDADLAWQDPAALAARKEAEAAAHVAPHQDRIDAAMGAPERVPVALGLLEEQVEVLAAPVRKRADAVAAAAEERARNLPCELLAAAPTLPGLLLADALELRDEAVTYLP